MADSTSDILPPGVNITPKISVEQSKILLDKLFGLKCKSIVELNAYDDKNYKVTVQESCGNEYISRINETGYVFKILNSFDSKKVSFVEAQNDMMLFLGKNNIKCSQPILNKTGQYYSIENIPESGDHIVRLLEYIPGKIFCDVQPSKELFFDAGGYIANLNIVLKALLKNNPSSNSQNFYHTAYKTHKSLWMLESVPEIKQFLYVIQNKDDLKMIEEIIFEFESKVLRNMGALEKSCIHGDFNEQNVIVKQHGNIWKVDAVLDFGDTQYSCLLFELAVAATYMIIQGKDLSMAGYFLAGYSTVRPIPEHEYQLLKICISARFCQSLVMGTYSNLQNPDNQYVLSTQATGWTLLKKLWTEPNETLIENWKIMIEKNKHIDKLY